MELRHLRYFLAVGEALSFTKAAARLRVAQPALSRQVQDLEDEIGVDLLRRSPRGVTLTAEGRLFLEEARELLKRTDDIGRALKETDAFVLNRQLSRRYSQEGEEPGTRRKVRVFGTYERKTVMKQANDRSIRLAGSTIQPPCHACAFFHSDAESYEVL